MKLAGWLIIGSVLVLVFSSWGFYAHYRINRLAVFTLPKAMSGFYRAKLNLLPNMPSARINAAT